MPPSNLKTEYALSPLIANVYAPSEASSELDGEAAPLGVLREHAKQVAGPDARLVAARAGADLDDDVLVVVGVALDHRQADLLLEALDLRARGAEHLAHLGVLALLEHLARARLVVLRAPPFLGELRRGLELTVRPPGRGRAVAIPEDVGVGHRARGVGEAHLDLLDEPLDHAVEGSAGIPAAPRRRRRGQPPNSGRRACAAELGRAWPGRGRLPGARHRREPVAAARVNCVVRVPDRRELRRRAFAVSRRGAELSDAAASRSSPAWPCAPAAVSSRRPAAPPAAGSVARRALGGLRRLVVAADRAAPCARPSRSRRRPPPPRTPRPRRACRRTPPRPTLCAFVNE